MVAQEREEERRSRGLNLQSPCFGLDYRSGVRFEVFVVGKDGASFLRKMFLELGFRMSVLEFNLGVEVVFAEELSVG